MRRFLPHSLPGGTGRDPHPSPAVDIRGDSILPALNSPTPAGRANPHPHYASHIQDILVLPILSLFPRWTCIHFIAALVPRSGLGSCAQHTNVDYLLVATGHVIRRRGFILLPNGSCTCVTHHLTHLYAAAHCRTRTATAFREPGRQNPTWFPATKGIGSGWFTTAP